MVENLLLRCYHFECLAGQSLIRHYYFQSYEIINKLISLLCNQPRVGSEINKTYDLIMCCVNRAIAHLRAAMIH
jgi:hypothetical protein